MSKMQYCMVICVMALLVVAVSSYVLNVPLTEVANATQRKAVCMDGSPAGYYFSRGSGEGAQNWLLYLMGGGWCENIGACQSRLNQSFGSSKFGPTYNFTGLLSDDKLINPDFYSWNRIFVVSCDQSSFLGDSRLDSPGPKIEFRGSRIFDAVVEDLTVQGLGAAENAILSGRSAGGLATILHCDDFRARLPNVGRVKCLSDAGFFIRAENVPNANYREKFYASTILVHNISSLLPPTCTERIDSSLCLFPEYLVGDIQTPLFLLNSAFDYFQVGNTLVPPSSPDHERWDKCLKNFTTCTSADIELIKDFGDAFLRTIREIPYNPSRGMFIDACFTHSVAYDEKYWAPNSTVKLQNLTVLEAFATWYFDKESVNLIASADFLEFCT